MSEVVKPCPFCGEILIIRPRSDGITAIECHTQSCPGRPGWTNIEQWNRRPIEDALRASIAAKDTEIKRLRKALDNLNIAAALDMRYSDSDNEEKAWESLKRLTEAMREANALLNQSAQEGE